ncbi:MAG: hypothetical protein LBG96_07585 [Tannerella sp.]|jgi:hypothetical protein|nr:hypothetical protein [Tannerella sp.]
MHDEIQRIISGKSKVRYGANIQAAINNLRTSDKSGALDKTDKHFKGEETERLQKYIDNQRLWIKIIDLNNFNPESGIILEDLHNENVLTSNGILYFIDTVFYYEK